MAITTTRSASSLTENRLSLHCARPARRGNTVNRGSERRKLKTENYLLISRINHAFAVILANSCAEVCSVRPLRSLRM